MRRTALLVALAGSAISTGERTSAHAAETKAAKRKPKLDQRTDERLRAMSQYIAGLKSFGFHAQNSTQIVTKGGQKLDLTAESVVLVRRPNRLRAAREGELASLVLYYDGATVTLFDNRTKQYATAPVPGSIDTMLPYVNQRHDIEVPGADLVSEDAYGLVTANAIEGSFVAEASLDGVRCDHFAFRGKDVDTQIWVQQGDTPIPRRYVITSKKMTGLPQYEVVIREFNPSVTAPDEAFAFRPPEGAKKIEPIDKKPKPKK